MHEQHILPSSEGTGTRHRASALRSRRDATWAADISARAAGAAGVHIGRAGLRVAAALAHRGAGPRAAVSACTVARSVLHLTRSLRRARQQGLVRVLASALGDLGAGDSAVPRHLPRWLSGPEFHPARSCPVAGLIQTRWGSEDSKRVAVCSTRDVIPARMPCF